MLARTLSQTLLGNLSAPHKTLAGFKGAAWRQKGDMETRDSEDQAIN